MVDGMISIIGLILCFIPIIMYVDYLMKHIKSKTKFDCHLIKVKDKKGIFGIIIAYLTKILFGIWVISLGILLLESFDNDVFILIFIITFVLYWLFKYIDEKNEK